MANTQAFCNSAKVEFLSANIALGTCDQTRTISNKDAFKAALYEVSAGDKDKTTTVYNTTGEVSGTGYTAGGEDVTNGNEPSLTNDVGHWTPSTDIVFGTVTLTTSFDAVLIYNDSWATKYAVSVHTFGSQTVTAGDFTLTMPTDDDSTALLRLT